MNHISKLALVIVTLFMFSFLINYFWESLHGFSLYEDHIIDSDEYVRMMVHMSFMDAVTILGIYIFIAFFRKDLCWLMRLTPKLCISFIVLGLMVAIIAEYWAINVSYIALHK